MTWRHNRHLPNNYLKFALYTHDNLGDIFKLRYEIFVIEDGRFGKASFKKEQITDRFDRLKQLQTLLLTKKANRWVQLELHVIQNMVYRPKNISIFPNNESR